MLLLSHLASAAPAERWTHDPFAADVADGYIYGRGAVDMKGMVAMELAVVRLLVDAARAAGRDPASDPIPGLRRDLLFTCTADEEAGAVAGARWIADHRPDWLLAAGALNECGGVATTVPVAGSSRSGRREGLRRITGRRQRHRGHGRCRARKRHSLAAEGSFRLATHDPPG